MTKSIPTYLKCMDSRKHLDMMFMVRVLGRGRISNDRTRPNPKPRSKTIDGWRNL